MIGTYTYLRRKFVSRWYKTILTAASSKIFYFYFFTIIITTRRTVRTRARPPVGGGEINLKKCFGYKSFCDGVYNIIYMLSVFFVALRSVVPHTPKTLGGFSRGLSISFFSFFFFNRHFFLAADRLSVTHAYYTRSRPQRVVRSR